MENALLTTNPIGVVTLRVAKMIGFTAVPTVRAGNTAASRKEKRSLVFKNIFRYFMHIVGKFAQVIERFTRKE